MNWTMKLTDEQLTVIKIALEEYFRVRLGQFWDLADDIAFQNCNNGDKLAWNDRYSRREAGRALFDGAFRALRPNIGEPRLKTENMLIAEDMWRVIRHELYMRRPPEERNFWCVDADKPLHVSDQPPIKLKEDVLRGSD